jgi:hypothetical protein
LARKTLMAQLRLKIFKSAKLDGGEEEIRVKGFFTKLFFDFEKVLKKENENQKSYLQKIHPFKTKN